MCGQAHALSAGCSAVAGGALSGSSQSITYGPATFEAGETISFVNNSTLYTNTILANLTTGDSINTPSTTGSLAINSSGSQTFNLYTGVSVGPAIIDVRAMCSGPAPAPLTLSPAAGQITGGTVGDAYSLALGASGGTGSYTFAVTSGSLPDGLTLNAASGAITGTPTRTISRLIFTVTVTDSAASTASATYQISIGADITLPAATVGVAYEPQRMSTDGQPTPISGSIPPGMTLTQESAVRVILGGTPQQAGTYIFTFLSGVRYTLVVNPPANLTLSPAAGALTGGTTGIAYSQTVTASGGTAPYTYAVTSGSLPSGLLLDPSTGKVSGTPTTASNSGFTITATDANRATGSAAYTLTISAPGALSLSPSVGALGGGTIGAAYSQTVTASGGTAPYGYAVTSGSLPGGLSLDPSTGKISGTPTAASNSSFTVTATDANRITGSAGYTIAISPPAASFTFTPPAGSLPEAMAGEDYRQSISAKGGTAPLIYSVASGALPKGMTLNISTGELTGPLAPTAAPGNYTFTLQVQDSRGAIGTAAYSLKVNAQKVTVTDQVIDVPAGSTPADVNLNRGATGGPFTSADIVSVEPANAGSAKITRGQLAQAGPAPPTGWYLQFNPDPAYSGQVRVGFRLTSALGVSNTGTVTYKLSHDAQKVARDIDALVHGFVQTRQNMISSAISVPGLMERQQMGRDKDPVTARVLPSESGLTLNFATSLAQMQGARDTKSGASAAASLPFNLWINGAMLAHNRTENDGKWGSFAMVNLGADYLLTEKALVGFSFHFDRMIDPSKEDTKLTGNGWLAGPYASFELGKGVFWDTSLRYGGSANNIDTRFWDGTFDTKRWMVDSSIKGQWNLDKVTVLTPRLRAVYFSERVEDYVVSNSARDQIAISGFDARQLRVSVGAEIARSYLLGNGSILTPKVGGTGGYSGLDGSGVFGTFTAGVSLKTQDQWTLDAGLLYNVEGRGQSSVGGKLGLGAKF
ncbi:putative Ig domain-containing protein [Bradyrhizobium sp. Leo170]|uniref:putative Ig domain-containing protein n=1 Tax=Bradyrhizobium sp. Leo170 TaxID=1571199 RepID=UPI0032E4C2CC